LRADILHSFQENDPGRKGHLDREFLIDGQLRRKRLVFTTKRMEWNGVPAALVIVDDVSEFEAELVSRNALIQGLKQDKDDLARDVRHRVGNSLQLILSLINLGISKENHDGGDSVLDAFRDRVEAIDQVYRCCAWEESGALAIPSSFIAGITSDLYASYGGPTLEGGKAELVVDVPSLPLELAIPLALIVEELFSAIIGRSSRRAKGSHKLIFSTLEDGGYLLELSGNSGLADASGIPASPPHLVRALVDQLGGTTETKNRKGSRRFRIRFPAARAV